MTALCGIVLLLAAPPATSQERTRESAEIRRELHRILSSPEYETLKPEANPKESFWRWIARKLGDLFDTITKLGSAAPGVFWTILTILLLVLAGILIHGGVIVVRALRASRTRAGPAPGKRARAEDAEALLARAAEAARQGQFTEAIRLCHRAALMGLDRRGYVRFQESLTSGDYRGQLRAHEAERTMFAELTRIYEPASFGKAGAGTAEYSESLRLAQRLAQEAAT